MNRLGIQSLNAGAPDIKYTGTEGPQDPRMASAYLGDKYMGMQDLVDEFKQRHGYDPMHDIDQWKKFLDMKRQDPEARSQERDTRTAGTYTQRRRNQMAGGGIMGSNAGSMLVAPTADGSRPGYGILSKIKNKIVDDIIPNEIKENPMATAALLGVGANYLDMIPGQMSSEGWIGDLLGGGQNLLNKGITGAKNIMGMGGPNIPTGIYPPGYTGNIPRDFNFLPSPSWTPGAGAPQAMGPSYTLDMDPRNLLEKGADWVKDQFGRIVDKSTGQPVTEQDQAQRRLDQTRELQRINWEVPMAVGAGAGAYQKKYLEDQPKFPGDETSIDFQTAKQVMADPEQRFKPQEQYVLPSALAAEGGRIGYDDGDFVDKIYSDEARTLAGTSGQPGGLLQERTDTGEYRFPEELKMTGQAHTRETLDAANKMLDIQEDKKLQLEKIALEKGWSKAKFNKKYKEYVEQQAGGIEGWGDSTQYDDLNEALGFMEHDLGVWSDDETPEISDFRLRKPNYKSMYQAQDGTFKSQGETFKLRTPMGKKKLPSYTQGGRIGYALGTLDAGAQSITYGLPGAPQMAPDGMEYDMSQNGGFQPLGAQEGKDDIKANLAKNEFVFTADAVRGAGDGDIETGAQRMYDTMKRLEGRIA